MVEPFCIRPARATDLPFVYAGELDYIRRIEPQQEDRWKAGMIRHLQQWTANLARMFIVEQGHTVVGYCFWEIHGDAAVLASIYVTSDQRRRGLGQRLLMTFLNHAQAEGFDVLNLAVKADNPAEGLYKQAGFCFTHDDHGYRHYRFAQAGRHG